MSENQSTTPEPEVSTSTTPTEYTVRCVWCGGPGLTAQNQTSLVMAHGVTESHETRLNRSEVSRSEHTVVYCPDCGGTLLRFIEGGVYTEPE